VNDAFRGVVALLGLVALGYAVRLFAGEMVQWIKHHHREHIARHVFFLTAGLAITVGLGVSTVLGATGINRPLHWREWMRLWSYSFIALGLVPLWRMHRSKKD
jgi:quinol-cytochrome oxidoreductase complex cytochrome b subunit